MSNEAYLDAIKEMDRIVYDINTRFKDHDKKFDAFISKYVRILNSWLVESDSDSDYMFEYLSELKDRLEGYIVKRLISDKGYYSDSQDTYHRWRKEE